MSDEALIDQIVSHVMERLRAGEAHARNNDRSTASSANNGTSKEKTSDENSSLVLTELVITAKLLEQKARGKNQLYLGTRAVLTPSAHDFLRAHKVEWSRQPSGAKSSTTNAARWMAIVVAATPAVDAALGDSQPAPWRRQLAGCWREATDAAVSAICRAEADGALIVCHETAACACRANRNQRVRAAIADNVAAIREIRQMMSANVYCIDPTNKSRFELRNILREVSVSPPAVASVWSE